LPPARGQRDPTWYELDDVTMAERRLDLLDRLAQMWSATTPAEIAGYKALLPPDAPVVRKAPLGQLAGVVEDLALIACDLAERATEAAAIKRLAELGAQHGSGVPGKSELIAPVRRVVANIVQLWQKIWDPTPPAPGTPIGAYLLGDSIGAGQFGTVFHVAAPVEDGNRVIKVVRNLRSASIAALFVRGAELTERLCTDARDGAYIVPINAILRSAPYPSYVMPKYGGVLQYELEHEYAGVATPPEWAERVAWHIGRALRAAHACGHYHGNVTPSNILFDDHRTSPVFRLADFELTDPVEHAAARAPVIADIAPVGARDEAASAVADRQWDDIVALSLIVCRMLTGKDVDLHAPQGLDATRVGLRQLTRGPSDKSPLVETLLRVLSPKRAGFGIEDFLVALASSRKRPALPILFLGANPPGTGRLGLNEEVKLIDRRLRMTSYRDAYELERCLDVRADELQELMLKHNPGIVHVSGHGTPDGQLVFVDRNGHSAPIPVKRLEGMFKTVAKQVRCVVLSACYSKAQAAAIRKSISVVIGMDDAILDHDAIAFAGEFYAALGHGATVKRAFEQGCNQIVSERARRDSARRDCVLLEPPPESLPLPVLIGSTVPAARLRFAPPSGDPQPATRTPRTARRRTRR
jgi:hypothetical protein